MAKIAYQTEIRPALSDIFAPKEFRVFKAKLKKVDEILLLDGLEYNILDEAIAAHTKKNNINHDEFCQSMLGINYYKRLRLALRCNISRRLVGESYRAFSIRVADSHLFQWFLGANNYGSESSVSKSSLERYEKLFDADEVISSIKNMIAKFGEASEAEKIGLKTGIDFSETFLDSTCIKANIHFPVDWVLLRDAARTLLLAIKLIRKNGLKNRMIEPAVLLKEMNKLCIKMVNVKRKKDSKKNQKSVLRDMKKLSTQISKHAKRYRELLAKDFEKTAISEAQMEQIICRIDNVLELLPSAIKQAHERIIGERVVKKEDKIISLYDKEADIIKRGKASGEFEFGQKFLLSEQRDGLITDWKVFAKESPNDSNMLKDSINRTEEIYGELKWAVGDRGFFSKSNSHFLEKKNISNGLCPKSVDELKKKLQDKDFADRQNRRSQTEARIGIFKNVFMKGKFKTRLMECKKHAVNWCVMAHNLSRLSMMAISDAACI